MFSIECMRMREFRKQYWISWLLTLDLDNFHFIQLVYFVAEGGIRLIIDTGFRKFRWISWISIFRPTGSKGHLSTPQLTPFSLWQGNYVWFSS